MEINHQRGSVPVIAIIAGVVILLAVLATLFSLTTGIKKPLPTAAPTYSGCINRDYGGCDEESEHFNWTDDGKR